MTLYFHGSVDQLANAIRDGEAIVSTKHGKQPRPLNECNRPTLVKAIQKRLVTHVAGWRNGQLSWPEKCGSFTVFPRLEQSGAVAAIRVHNGAAWVLMANGRVLRGSLHKNARIPEELTIEKRHPAGGRVWINPAHVLFSWSVTRHEGIEVYQLTTGDNLGVIECQN